MIDPAPSRLRYRKGLKVKCAEGSKKQTGNSWTAIGQLLTVRYRC